MSLSFMIWIAALAPKRGYAEATERYLNLKEFSWCNHILTGAGPRLNLADRLVWTTLRADRSLAALGLKTSSVIDRFRASPRAPIRLGPRDNTTPFVTFIGRNQEWQADLRVDFNLVHGGQIVITDVRAAHTLRNRLMLRMSNLSSPQIVGEHVRIFRSAISGTPDITYDEVVDTLSNPIELPLGSVRWPDFSYRLGQSSRGRIVRSFTRSNEYLSTTDVFKFSPLSADGLARHQEAIHFEAREAPWSTPTPTEGGLAGATVLCSPDVRRKIIWKHGLRFDEVNRALKLAPFDDHLWWGQPPGEGTDFEFLVEVPGRGPVFVVYRRLGVGVVEIVTAYHPD